MESRAIARHPSQTAMFSILLCVFWAMGAEAWISPCLVQRPSALSKTTTTTATLAPTTTTTTTLYADASVSVASSSSQEEEEEEEEYEYVEYDALTEAEFVGSEWLVGTNWDQNEDKIEETWVRLVVSEDGKNLCYWGDKSEGKWNLDVASQFLSISKESFWGKQIWAGIVDDYYYLQGTVRGWTYLQPASVLAQWQAKRLGVDKDEAGTAPWFEQEEDDADEEGSAPKEEAKE